MTPDALPPGIIVRFRTLSLERLGRVEAAWAALLGGVHDEPMVRELARDLHTLKGDAKIVGFDDVHVLAEKLEELTALAKEHDYKVSDDVDLVVTMAIQFLGLLLRKKSGSSMSGIDLEGFVRQVDEVLRESRTLPSTPRTITSVKTPSAEDDAWLDRLSEPTQRRLAIAATNAFLEYLSARGGTSRTRLRSVWATLRDELSAMHAVPVARVLERHVATSHALARGLGKRIAVVLDVGKAATGARAAEAIDIAALHLIRNAIDHGIEDPAARVAAGKPETGSVTIRAVERHGMMELTVQDDGHGIDAAVIRRAVTENGLVDPQRAAQLSDAEVLDLVFLPGFSTRQRVTELSGRGVGMDAVKSALVRAGGAVRLTSTPGRGTTISISIPASARQVRVYQFLAPGGAVSLAISARWTAAVDPAPGPDVLDPTAAIQLAGTSRQTVVDLSRPVRDLALRLRWGFLEIAVRASTEPALVTAERICPTPDDFPIEVVAIDGHETILIRPEHLATLVERSRAQPA